MSFKVGDHVQLKRARRKMHYEWAHGVAVVRRIGVSRYFYLDYQNGHNNCPEEMENFELVDTFETVTGDPRIEGEL